MTDETGDGTSGKEVNGAKALPESGRRPSCHLLPCRIHFRACLSLSSTCTAVIGWLRLGHRTDGARRVALHWAAIWSRHCYPTQPRKCSQPTQTGRTLSVARLQLRSSQNFAAHDRAALLEHVACQLWVQWLAALPSTIHVGRDGEGCPTPHDSSWA